MGTDVNQVDNLVQIEIPGHPLFTAMRFEQWNVRQTSKYFSENIARKSMRQQRKVIKHNLNSFDKLTWAWGRGDFFLKECDEFVFDVTGFVVFD